MNAPEPKYCCSTKPDIFTDTKIGSTIKCRVVNCAQCGKYSDDPDESKAIWKWNNNFRFKNPIDKEFQARLEAAKR